MLEELMRHLHNWFPRTKVRGTFRISGGALEGVDFLLAGQYYRIKGSIMNDGLHNYGCDDLADETFEGEIWGLAPPRAFIELADEIELWRSKYAEALDSPYQSENVIGVYSYTTKSGGSGSGSGSGDGGISWQSHFKARLNPYRRLPDVD